MIKFLAPPFHCIMLNIITTISKGMPTLASIAPTKTNATNSSTAQRSPSKITIIKIATNASFRAYLIPFPQILCWAERSVSHFLQLRFFSRKRLQNDTEAFKIHPDLPPFACIFSAILPYFTRKADIQVSNVVASERYERTKSNILSIQRCLIASAKTFAITGRNLYFLLFLNSREQSNQSS